MAEKEREKEWLIEAIIKKLRKIDNFEKLHCIFVLVREIGT